MNTVISEKTSWCILPIFDLNLKLNYTFVLNDHIKLQLNGGVQNLFNAFQKDLDKGGFRDSGTVA